VIRRLLHRVVHEEDGIALILALATMMVLAITTTGILVAGTANQRTAFVSDQAREAFAIAQESLAYAEGMVYGDAANGVTPPHGAQTLPNQPVGSGTYYASTGDGTTWNLTGTGTVGGVTRTVTAQATPPSSTTVTESGVWNYIYSNTSASPNCTTDTWDTLAGGTTVTVPILTRAGFCIVGGSKFQNPASGASPTLNVGGNLVLLGGGKIGASSGSKVAGVEVAGSPSSTACENQSNPTTPGTGVCDGTHNDLWATTVGTTLAVQPAWPTVDFAGAYTAQAALPQSGCPANLFDNDSTMNKSDASIVSVLFGGTSYDCKLGSAAKPCLSTQNVCELKWTASTKTLAMTGRFYFDGSINVSSTKIQYTGQASLYFTGSVEFSGGSQFCGIANCTTSWNPDVNGAIFVSDCWSNSTGSTLVNPKCVYVTGGSNVQFGTYCTTDYSNDGGSSNMGPVLANTFTLAGGANTLIPFHTFPPGTPLATQTITLPGTPPTNWSG